MPSAAQSNAPLHLPGRLRATTLGDLLGSLHRARATGTLELTVGGARSDRSHRVYVHHGLVVAVELDGASGPSLAEILRDEGAANEDLLRRSLLRSMTSSRLHGQVLIDDFHVAPSVIGKALRVQLLTRLGVLDRLSDARVSFRVALRPPRGALTGAPESESHPAWNSPLGPLEFLPGRRRARARCDAAGGRRSPDEYGAPLRDRERVDVSAWQVLGLSPGAPATDIKRAYRRLARTVHPDLHPHASDAERRTLAAQFAKLTDAYRRIA